MTRNQRKKLLPLLLVAALGFFVSSCNRGLGCPSNFSAKTIVSGLSQSINQALLK